MEATILKLFSGTLFTRYFLRVIACLYFAR